MEILVTASGWPGKVLRGLGEVGEGGFQQLHAVLERIPSVESGSDMLASRVPTVAVKTRHRSLPIEFRNAIQNHYLTCVIVAAFDDGLKLFEHHISASVMVQKCRAVFC